jgi:hypothetical protein
MDYLISKETLDGVLEYLSKKPFIEVTQIINQIVKEVNDDKNKKT